MTRPPRSRPTEHPACYFGRFSDMPCDGRTDPCHIVSKRVIKREHSRANPRVRPAWFSPSPLTGTDLPNLLADRRNIVASCRRHHGNADNFFIDYEVPESARSFAAEFGLSHFLPTEPEREAA